MIGLSEVQLKEDQYAIHIKDRVLNQTGDFSGRIKIQGTDGTLSFAGYHTEGFSQNGHNGGDYIIIVLYRIFNRGISESRYGALRVEKNIKNIRQSIAKTLGAKDKEIYFTSGGTESNNTIIRGIVALNKKRKNHIISTTIEHPSVLNTLKDLESEGCEVTYLEVDKNGKIDIEEFKNALKPTTCLVTIMHVNNEIGSIQPIQEISKHLKTCLLYTSPSPRD